jgi:hypothetical protein
MLTDDLFGGVAFEALRARIPVGYDPVGIEHVDGIVRDRVDQQAVSIVIGICVAVMLFAIHSVPFIVPCS